jgi:glycosyltransferase involved in cell wall biosynthesis
MRREDTVCFLTFDWAYGTDPLEPNGCAWYRCILPAKEVQKHGWETGVGFPGWNDEHGFGMLIPEDKAIHGWDIIIFKLVMLKSIAEKREIAQKLGQKIVVDIDDWFEGLEKTNLAYKMTDPEKNADNNREHYLDIIYNADALITSTPFLYNFYKNEKNIKNVFLVRNGIDIDRWTPRKDFSRWLPKLGWVGATPWRSMDLETMAPWFGQFLEKNRLTFHHSGNIKNADSAIHQLGIPSTVKTSTEPMRVISKYPEIFRKIDIGIVPLNNIGFNHAKSTIKGLEYAAAGVPFVASYSPEYAILEQQGVGRVANNPQEWIGHLEELLDPKIRKEDIERNLENIKKTQTIELRGQEWAEVLHEIKKL